MFPSGKNKKKIIYVIYRTKKPRKTMPCVFKDKYNIQIVNYIYI